MNIETPSSVPKNLDVVYWKTLAYVGHERKDAIEKEFQEFQEHSQMLEKELEKSLEQAERSNKHLQQTNMRLAAEVHQLRTKLDQETRDCAMYQGKAQELQVHHEHLLKYIRELEQKNDDLERANRINKATEEDIETKFNLVLEKNALLESELDEKESLKVIVQRLKDEIRDLKQEIQVQERYQTNNDKAADIVSNHVDSNKLQVELETHIPPDNPLDSQAISLGKIGNAVTGGVTTNNNNNNVSSPLAPCTRILAMNVIGDLMRKVGALENKLNTCRNASREDQAVRDLYSIRR